MPFQFHSARFETPGSPADKVITGVGFQPKLLIIWACSADVDVFDVDYVINMGFASSSDTAKQRSFTVAMSDNSAVADAQSAWHTSAVFTDGFAGALGVGTLKSFDADGFTLNWNGFSSNWETGFLAMGGTDMTNATVGHFNAPSSTGLHQVTGLGFLPDFVFLLGTSHTTDNEIAFGPCNISFGVMNGVGEQAVSSNMSIDDVTTMDTARYQRTDKCLAIFNSTNSAALTHEAAFSTMDNDGFTLNFTTASGANKRVAYAAFQGPQTKITSMTTPIAGALPLSLPTTGLGLAPKAIILPSVDKTASSSIVTNSRFTIGGSGNPDNQWTTWTGSSDATANAVCAARCDSTKILRLATEAAAAGSSTTQALASLESLDEDGFTLNYTVIDAANAYEVIVIAFADAEAPEPITSAISSTSMQSLPLRTLGCDIADQDYIETVHV